MKKGKETLVEELASFYRHMGPGYRPTSKVVRRRILGIARLIGCEVAVMKKVDEQRAESNE